MNNYIYTLSNSQNVIIDKLHVCTWDLEGQKASVELGLSIPNSDNLPEHFVIYLFAPFLNNHCVVNSLHRELNDAENFKFIFNEKHLGSDNIGDDGRFGHIIRYNTNGNERRMAIIKPECELGGGYLELSLNKPVGEYANLYCRVHVRTIKDTLAQRARGISKDTYKYDVKINEERNIPSGVTDFKNQNDLSVAKVETAYCLHCVPNDYELSYSDARKLVSIRILELDAFRQYIGSLNNIEGEHIIAFQKDSLSGSGSFFTTFSRERIGNKQLTMAIGTNLLCNLLFAIYSLRNQQEQGSQPQFDVPFELLFASVLIIACLVYCLSLWTWFVRMCKKVKAWIWK